MSLFGWFNKNNSGNTSVAPGTVSQLGSNSASMIAQARNNGDGVYGFKTGSGLPAVGQTIVEPTGVKSLFTGDSVSNTGGLSDVNANYLDRLISQLSSALESEFASSASQIQAQKDLIDYSNEFSARQAELNRIFQQNSADKAMKFSADEAQKNREFQVEMANSAYQRVVADLQAAGLNPILAYTQGGASAPSGSSGSAYQASGSSASSASGTASKANASSAWSADLALDIEKLKILGSLGSSAVKLISMV